MYGAPVSKDLNLPAQPQQPAAGVRTPPQMSSPGLLRYRSAPSTLLGEVCGDFLPAAGAGVGHRPASPDHGAADTVLASFLAGNHPEVQDKPPRPAEPAAHFPEDAASLASQQQQLMYQSQQQMAAMGGLYRTVSSGSTDPAGGGGNSLLRQSSSPAGFLNHLNMDNGYGGGGHGYMLRTGMGSGGGGFRNGDARLKGQVSFSSRQGSVMSRISEIGSEELGGSSSEAGSNGVAAARSYSSTPGYPMGASSGWEEPSPSPSLLSGNLSGVKRARVDVPNSDSPAAQQAANGAQLTHQFSLPSNSKPSPGMAAIEKFLQFQDAVPCKIRAKRGCATHPRSIAERVRRTRISDRIRKLQELVPSMEKQTNTADMLDLAVDYIKDLQKQVKVLNDGRAKCTCPTSKRQQFLSFGPSE